MTNKTNRAGATGPRSPALIRCPGPREGSTPCPRPAARELAAGLSAIGGYDFPYSDELTAESPARPRDASRLLVLDRRSGAVVHGRFRDLPRFLRPGDRLVVNRTKVLPARLIGRKATGGRADVLLLRELAPGRWTALSSDLRPGAKIEWEDGVCAIVERWESSGEWACRFSDPDVRGLMARRGLPPIPPYILKKRRRLGAGDFPEDAERYQTVYAREEGSVAAPTAGLHFTENLLDELRRAGVAIVEVTLHVGRGTFQPITAGDVRRHRMKGEWYRIEPEAARTLERGRAERGRVVAVGTTSTRAVESFARTGRLEGRTELYIRPGHDFRLVDALVTNFHQPRSTPLVLACAFAGREKLREAYRRAVELRYRLYSFGDAMLIV